jgi:hypothetical protein
MVCDEMRRGKFRKVAGVIKSRLSLNRRRLSGLMTHLRLRYLTCSCSHLNKRIL